MCDCNLCKENRLIEYHIEKIPEEQKNFFEGFIERHYDDALSAEYNKAILDGSWPNAVEILEDALENAKRKRLEKEMNE